jgi:hypothetical protein
MLASVSNLLLLQVLINIVALYKVAYSSAHRANNNFLVLEEGLEA